MLLDVYSHGQRSTGPLSPEDRKDGARETQLRRSPGDCHAGPDLLWRLGWDGDSVDESQDRVRLLPVLVAPLQSRATRWHCLTALAHLWRCPGMSGAGWGPATSTEGGSCQPSAGCSRARGRGCTASPDLLLLMTLVGIRTHRNL